jgi:transposase
MILGLGRMAVARPPEVFVRPLSMAEGQRLQRINRTAKDRVRLRRAMIVLASAQGWPVPDIADLAQVSQRYVRQVIHEFNDKGFGAFDPKWSGGAPRTIDDTTRTRIYAIAGCDPQALGQPFSTWSLNKLADYLIETGTVAAISREILCRILHDGGISWQTLSVKMIVGR